MDIWSIVSEPIGLMLGRQVMHDTFSEYGVECGGEVDCEVCSARARVKFTMDVDAVCFVCEVEFTTNSKKQRNRAISSLPVVCSRECQVRYQKTRRKVAMHE